MAQEPAAVAGEKTNGDRHDIELIFEHGESADRSC